MTTRRPRAALRHAEQRMHAETPQFRLVEDVDGGAELLERGRSFGQSFGINDVGGFGDEIAGEEHGIRRFFQRLVSPLGGAAFRTRHSDSLERRLLLGLLLRFRRRC
jgi:hypothetical protein